jgi:hypothetical protein
VNESICHADYYFCGSELRIIDAKTSPARSSASASAGLVFTGTEASHLTALRSAAAWAKVELQMGHTDLAPALNHGS